MAFLAQLTGCTGVSTSVRNRDTFIRKGPVLEKPLEEYAYRGDAEFDQANIRLTVKKVHRCEFSRTTFVDRTVFKESTVSMPWLLSRYILGGVAGGVGGLMFYTAADLPSSPQEDLITGEEQPHPTLFWVGGGIMAAAGAALLSWALVDSIKAIDTEEHVGEVRVSKPLKPADCTKHHPASGVEVIIGYGGGNKDMQKTNSEGVVSFKVPEDSVETLATRKVARFIARDSAVRSTIKVDLMKSDFYKAENERLYQQRVRENIARAEKMKREAAEKKAREEEDRKKAKAFWASARGEAFKQAWDKYRGLKNRAEGAWDQRDAGSLAVFLAALPAPLKEMWGLACEGDIAAIDERGKRSLKDTEDRLAELRFMNQRGAFAIYRASWLFNEGKTGPMAICRTLREQYYSVTREGESFATFAQRAVSHAQFLDGVVQDMAREKAARDRLQNQTDNSCSARCSRMGSASYSRCMRLCSGNPGVPMKGRNNCAVKCVSRCGKGNYSCAQRCATACGF